MKTPQRPLKVILTALAVAVAIAFFSTAVEEDEGFLDTSNPFNLPLDLLPDDAVIEAYRIMGYEHVRDSQKTLSKLFTDMLHESETPCFAYVTSQVMRNADLLSKALNNSSILRLYKTILSDQRTMRRYQQLTENYRRYRTWLYVKQRPPSRIEGMLKADIAESLRLGLRPWSGPLVEVLADYYFYLREDEQALRRLEESLACDIEGEHISAASHIAGRIGIYHLKKGNMGESEQCMLQSLQYARLSGDPYYLARSLSFLAQVRAMQGHFAEAESLSVQSIEYGRKTKDPKAEFSRIASLADLEVSFGEYTAAAALVEKAISMAEESLSDPSSKGNVFYRNLTAHYLAQCLMLRGTIQLAQHEHSASIATMERALNTCRGTIDRSFEASLRKKLGDAYAGAGRGKEAMQCYEEALGVARKLKEKEREAECLTSIGALHFAGGEHRRAERILKKAIDIEMPALWMQRIQTLAVLARVEEALGAYVAARSLLEESIAILDSELTGKKFVENRYALSQQLREIFGALLALEGEHFYDCDSLLAAAEKTRLLRIGERGIQGGDFNARIRRCLTERNWVPENAVIIQHLVTSTGLIIAAMDRYGETYRMVSIAPERLQANIDAFIEACTAPRTAEGAPDPGATGDTIDEKGRALYDLLLGPIAALLAGKDELCFIPDEPLRRLPFGALIPPGRDMRFLIESKRIVASPNLLSASRRLPHGQRPGQEFSSPLIVGHPEISARTKIRYPHLATLPYVESEITEISGLLAHCTILAGRHATKAAVLAGLTKADHIHIAAHRIPYPAYGGQSALLVSDGGGGENEPMEASLITESEIRKLDLSRAKLVVLSTCESATGERNAPGQTLGLAGAFLDAGAQSVIATTWPVEDREAGQFLTSFYREMIRGKINPQKALQAAQQRVIQANRSNGSATANIRSWAPYLFFSSL